VETTLPALSGSDKQVEWAERIRAEKIAEIRANEARLGEWMGPLPDQERGLPVLLAQADAGWWINHRRADGARLAETVGKRQRLGMPLFRGW